MSLFDKDAHDIGNRSKLYSESIFKYYNQSSRAAMAEIRRLLDDWFGRYPCEGKLDLRQRFRSDDDRQHEGAFLELYVHELLLQLAYTADVHPEIDESTHPDFLILRDSERRFYVEATTTAPSNTEVGRQKLMDRVYDTLNQLQSPNFFLVLKLLGAPQAAPPGTALRRKLENWLNGLDWDEVRARWEHDGFDGLPTYAWEHAGWSIIFQALPKSDESRGSADVRPIGMTMPAAMHQLSVDDDVKSAVGVKNKYGQLDLPFVVAINVIGDFCSRYDVMNALFGHETVIFGPGGTRPGERLHDGAWDGPQGPQNTTISAVMVFRSLTPWNARERVPWFVHNPWAARPLDPTELPFSQFVPDPTTGHLVLRDGRPPGDFLDLPNPWPPMED